MKIKILLTILLVVLCFGGCNNSDNINADTIISKMDTCVQKCVEEHECLELDSDGLIIVDEEYVITEEAAECYCDCADEFINDVIKWLE